VYNGEWTKNYDSGSTSSMLLHFLISVNYNKAHKSRLKCETKYILYKMDKNKTH